MATDTYPMASWQRAFWTLGRGSFGREGVLRRYCVRFLKPGGARDCINPIERTHWVPN